MRYFNAARAGDGGDNWNSRRVGYWNFDLRSPSDQNLIVTKMWPRGILKEKKNLTPSPKHKVKVKPAPRGLATIGLILRYTYEECLCHSRLKHYLHNYCLITCVDLLLLIKLFGVRCINVSNNPFYVPVGNGGDNLNGGHVQYWSYNLRSPSDQILNDTNRIQ